MARLALIHRCFHDAVTVVLQAVCWHAQSPCRYILNPARLRKLFCPAALLSPPGRLSLLQELDGSTWQYCPRNTSLVQMHLPASLLRERVLPVSTNKAKVVKENSTVVADQKYTDRASR